MKKLMLVTAALMLAACGRQLGDEFRAGVPSTDDVKLNVPSKSGQALESDDLGTSRQALEQGKTSDFYQLTRGVTVGVNGGTAFVLGLVKSVTDHQPTSVTGNTAVWGPYTDALSPTTWKLTVNKVSDTEYSYKFEGKAKQDADTEFKTVLSGTHKPVLDANGDAIEHIGSGDFILDWNESQKLPEHDDNVGTAHITYSRLDATADTKIDVAFTQVKDNENPGKLIDANYKYVEHTGHDGEFEFATNKDVDNGNPARPGIERLTIKSRWTNQGAGRSDVKATGGDLTSQATASECWDVNFLSQYLVASWDPNAGYGTEAAGCTAFPAASYSSL